MIDEFNVDLVCDLCFFVWERLVIGDIDEEVMDYVVVCYGDFVFLLLLFKLSIYLFWVFLVLVFVLGVGLFVYVCK